MSFLAQNRDILERQMEALMLSKIIQFSILGLCLSWSANWSQTRLEVFTGSGYGVPFAGTGNNIHGETDLEVFSFTHASGNQYGGNFFFFDVERQENDQLQYYGEWSPSVMLGAVSGSPLKLGLLKDMGLMGTLEFAPRSLNKLVGAKIALNIPGFAFLDLMPLLREDPNKSGLSFQMSTAWLVPINIGPISATFDGFIDYALAEGDSDSREYSAANFHTQTAVFVDIAKFVGQPGLLSVGVEYRYWQNKFGIEGLDEAIPQFGIRSVF